MIVYIVIIHVCVYDVMYCDKYALSMYLPTKVVAHCLLKTVERLDKPGNNICDNQEVKQCLDLSRKYGWEIITADKT